MGFGSTFNRVAKRMGACCQAQMKGERNDGLQAKMNGGKGNESEDIVTQGDFGALVRLQGCSTFVSMHSQQGRKGINQDSMTVWEVITNFLQFMICPFVYLFLSISICT